jgi:hypothetical protein
VRKTRPRRTQGPRTAEGQKKLSFIDALAEYLCKDQAKMSILLEMGNDHARHWARLRNLTPLNGYPTVEEAKRILVEFLR